MERQQLDRLDWMKTSFGSIKKLLVTEGFESVLLFLFDFIWCISFVTDSKEDEEESIRNSYAVIVWLCQRRRVTLV